MSPGPTGAARGSVLVVDDSPEDQTLIADLLLGGPDRARFPGALGAASAWTVLTAATGAEALALWAGAPAGSVRCVLLDYRLPDMDGLECLDAIRAAERAAAPPAEVPIIVLTGLGSEAVAAEALARGAQDYLVKGRLTPDVLWRTMEGATRRVEYERTLREQRVALERSNTALAAAAASERALRAEAEALRDQALAASRAKSEFLATMSHELRTPLNAIQGYAQLLELGLMGPVTDAQTDALQRIQRSQAHLLTLINDVLDVARIESGRLEVSLSEVSLDELLAEVRALVEPQAGGRGVQVVVPQCDPTLVLRTDRAKLTQILLNLVSNGAKFTKAGGRVTIGWEFEEAADRADERPSRLRLVVSDTGCGIAADQLTRIFEPFVQADQRLTRTADGSGLGLAISQRLARAMGGELSVESQVGVGSTFTLVLPGLVAAHEARLARSTRSRTPAP